MTGEAQIVEIWGQRTRAHVRVLEGQDLEIHAPGTHYGVCRRVEGIEAGQAFDYGAERFEILRVWDEDQAQLDAKRARSVRRQKVPDPYAATRAGKFLHMVLVIADPAGDEGSGD